jgi:hypothetical protein
MLRVGKSFGVIAFCVLAVILAGCGKEDGGKQSQSAKQAPAQSSEQTAGQAAPGSQAPAGNQAPSPEDYTKMAEQNRQALTQMNKGKVIEAVTGDTLKALLPADLPGMKRTNTSAERTQMMGVDMSKAEGQYSQGDNGEGTITVTITDAGNMSGPMRMGMVGWTMAQYSRETDNGYEKTMTYKGYKGMEEYNKSDKNGTVRLFVADRFIVEVEGNGITMDALKQALDKIDLAKLSSAASGS